MSELVALLDGRVAGRVKRAANGRVSFAYADSWRSTPGAYPISLSMPLAAAEHPHAVVDAFLWGLLPDNELTLHRWGQRFHASPRNAFGLIEHVGEDCAGAVQFVKPGREDELQRKEPTDIEWLSDSEVAQRLRRLGSDIGAGRIATDHGQFSLAGAQPKTALLFDGKRWGIPSGRMPTTHIIKPVHFLDGHAHNEHLCLALARTLGMPTASTRILEFEGVTAIVVERYDRVDTAGLAASEAAKAAAKAAEAAMHAASHSPEAAPLAAKAAAEAAAAATAAETMSRFSKMTPYYRVHQEDLCQSLGIHPAKKYQNQGGPSPEQIIALIRTHWMLPIRKLDREHRAFDPAKEDISTFIDSLVFNWLIGGSDAHAKNYSVLLGGSGVVRLAPLYDISSIYGHDEFDPRKSKMAMKIGGTYGIEDIDISAWKKFSSGAGIDQEELVGRIAAMASQLPDRLSAEVENLDSSGLSHPIIDKLSKALAERARRISRKF